jgi:anti-anti-sigma factor
VPGGRAAAPRWVLPNPDPGPYVAAVAEDSYPVQWADRRAVVTLPDYIDVSNAQRISETLLQVINRGAEDLIVDMTGTAACDYAGADAFVRAYQRAAASGTQLRIVVTAPVVRRVLSINGLDRLVPVYPSLEAATAAAALAAGARPAPGVPAAASHPGGGRAVRGHLAGDRSAVVTQEVLRSIIDALADGVALADGDGTLVLASRRLEDMFGYGRGELAGRPVDALLPVDLRESHRRERARYARGPRSRPMGAGAPLIGLRADGTTFPVTVSLSPVPTATSHLVLAVVRDNTATPGGDLLDLARRAAAADQAQASRDLLDRVVSSLFDVGVSLQAAASLPHHSARQRIMEALQRLDDTIHEIRDHVFAAFGHPGTSGPPDGAG